MKTLSKVLSMLIVVVMCMSFFGASASAISVSNSGSAKVGSSGGLRVSSSDEFATFDEGITVAASNEVPGKTANTEAKTVEEKQTASAEENDNTKAEAANEEDLIKALKNAEVTSIKLTGKVIVSGNNAQSIDLGGRTVTINMNGFQLAMSDITVENGNVVIKGEGDLQGAPTKGDKAEVEEVKEEEKTEETEEEAKEEEKKETEVPEEDIGGIALNTYFLVENSKHVKGDGKDVVIKLYAMPDLSSGDYEYSGLYCVRGYNGASEISGSKLTSAEVDHTLVGEKTIADGTAITINEAYLDTLPAGEYTLFYAVHGPNAQAIDEETVYAMANASFTVEDKSSVDPDESDGNVEVHTRYFSEWSQGDDPLQFVIKPHGKNLKLFVDGKEVNVLDWYDYHDGYFYLGTKLLESLGGGSHKLYVTNDKGEAACYFYVHHTLTPKDTTKHVIGSYKDLKYLCSAPIETVMVGGKVLSNIDGDYYYLSKDGKTLTLTSTFLNNRVAGNTYKLEVITTDGERLPSYFQILTTAQASASPKTGDDSALSLWAALLLISGVAVATTVPVLKKNKG